VADKLHVAKPPKPISDMTDEERRAWAEKVYDALVAAEQSTDQ
jgi:hypothetical protein